MGLKLTTPWHQIPSVYLLHHGDFSRVPGAQEDPVVITDSPPASKEMLARVVEHWQGVSSLRLLISNYEAGAAFLGFWGSMNT